MSREPMRVILIDDDDVDIMSVKRAFRRKGVGATFHVARDGVEGLEALRRNGPDAIPQPYVILLDLNMPRMNGIELLQELRSDPALRGAVVFVMTTSQDANDLAAAYGLQVAGYIPKAGMDLDFGDVATMLEAYWRVVDLPGAT